MPTTNDRINLKKINLGGEENTTVEDEDIVQFDLTGDASDGPELHVNLTDEEITEETTSIDNNPKDDYSFASSDESSSFSLAGDDLLSLFDQLQKTIDDETKKFLNSQRQHKENIVREEKAMRDEKIKFEEKKQKMLDGIQRLQQKLTGSPRSK